MSNKIDSQLRSEKARRAKWVKTKDRVLKRFRKPHIFPPIIALIAFVLFAELAVAALIFIYTSITAGTQLGKSSMAAYRFKDACENVSSVTGNLDYKNILPYAGLTDKDSVAVMNSDGAVIFTSGDIKFRYQNYLSLPAFVKIENKDATALIDYKNVFMELLTGNSVLKKARYLINNDTDAFAEWLDKRETGFDAWAMSVSKSELQVFLVHDTIYLSNKDMLLFVVVIMFSGIVSGLPVLFYIHASVRNIISNRRTRRVYYLDPVTLGKNWQYFLDKVNVLTKKNHHRSKYAMVCIHMDKYQNYCICYGKEDGEWLLARTYNTIKKNLSHKEYFARNYAAEFGLMLKYSSKEELERRIVLIEKQIMTIVPDRVISFTAGICEAGDKRCSSDILYSMALIAKSAVTDSSDLRLAWFDDDMKNERIWEKHVEERQEKALENHEFQVYVQPKHDPITEEMNGGEALIRWINEEDGFIVPGKFIPIFEKNGFIMKIDDFMISEVARLQSQWISEGKKVVPVSVNVSRIHFADPKLAEHISALVDKYNTPHEVIEIEITESAYYDDKEAMLSAVRKLKEYGFEISMDDFGTGYSSLNSLRELPLDVLKLDAEFFRGEGDDARREIVVSDAITLARHLNMRIVAEGVERKDQVDFLAGQNCDMIQGYYFAKPMPAEEYSARLKAAEG